MDAGSEGGVGVYGDAEKVWVWAVAQGGGVTGSGSGSGAGCEAGVGAGVGAAVGPAPGPSEAAQAACPLSSLGSCSAREPEL